MNLAVVNEAVTGMNGVEHEFTEEEKNFVVQFAFRSGSKEDTISLIEALAHSTDKVQSGRSSSCSEAESPWLSARKSSSQNTPRLAARCPPAEQPSTTIL